MTFNDNLQQTHYASRISLAKNNEKNTQRYLSRRENLQANSYISITNSSRCKHLPIFLKKSISTHTHTHRCNWKYIYCSLSISFFTCFFFFFAPIFTLSLFYYPSLFSRTIDAQSLRQMFLLCFSHRLPEMKARSDSRCNGKGLVAKTQLC